MRDNAQRQSLQVLNSEIDNHLISLLSSHNSADWGKPIEKRIQSNNMRKRHNAMYLLGSCLVEVIDTEFLFAHLHICTFAHLLTGASNVGAKQRLELAQENP